MSQAGSRCGDEHNSGGSLRAETDHPSLRKRRFAHKSRLGCVNCKCVVAELDCSYKPPKAWIFVPKELAPSCSASPRTTSSTSGHGTPGHYINGSHRDRLRSHSDVEVGSLTALPSQTPFKSQSEYQAFGSWFCFLMNYAEPRSRFSGNTTEFWLELIPQAAFSSSALRYAMIASGYMALSLAKKEVGAAEMQSRRMTLSYANQAIRALASQSNSILETVLTAWTFWQLELLDGDLRSAMLHMHSAIKIVQHAASGNHSDRIAKSFIEGMTSGVSTPSKQGTGSWSPFNEADSVVVRKRRAVLTLTEAFPKLEACGQRVLASNAPAKTTIVAILDEACQEIQWCLKKWLPLDEYVAWRARAIDVNRHEASTTVSLFYNVVQDLDEYLAGSDDFLVDEWELLVYRNFLMLFLSAVTSDLPFRHDMFDFIEFGRQVREPRRPTLGRSQCLPFNYDIFSR